MATRPTYGPISSYSRVQILHQLQEHPRSTIAELCEVTKLHPNTVREHIQRLIDGGYITAESEHRTTRGRPRMLYSAVDGTTGEISEVAAHKAEAAAARGDALRRLFPNASHQLDDEAEHQLDALVEHLEESGFDPVIDEAALTLDLSPCPHAAASPEHRPTLCSVHLGLMQGVLTAAGGPLQTAFVCDPTHPSDCTVQLKLLTTRPAADAAEERTPHGVA